MTDPGTCLTQSALPPRMLAALSREWQRLATAGAMFTATQRIAIAANARQARRGQSEGPDQAQPFSLL